MFEEEVCGGLGGLKWKRGMGERVPREARVGVRELLVFTFIRENICL